jgi:hypothetical protein
MNKYEIALELYEEYLHSIDYYRDTTFKLWCREKNEEFNKKQNESDNL